MSRLNEHPAPVKLILNAFYKDDALLERALDEWSLIAGPVEARLEPRPFEHTDYYSEEMGQGLKKVLVSYRNLVPRDSLVRLKRAAVLLEQKLATRHADGFHRPVNLDPGLLLPEKFLLATGKNFPHRIYLGRGVYADLTLIFRHGRFEMLPWTYTDYLEHDVLAFLATARERLLVQLKDRHGV